MVRQKCSGIRRSYLVKMKNLTKEQQPHSDDPDFWDVWTRKYADGKLVERTVDWEAVVKEWQQK